MSHKIFRPIIVLIFVIGLMTLQLPLLVQAAESVSVPLMAPVVANGNFETGNLSGWSLFTTNNGVSFTNVVPFDTNGDGVATYSAQFSVGQLVYQGVDFPEGGGIYQVVNLVKGDLKVTADIASNHPYDSCNLSGGLFRLLLDGVVVDTHDFDLICNFETKRSTLNANISIDTAGAHEIRFVILRPFQLSGVANYLDNIVLSGSATVTSIEIDLDIKPGSEANPINTKSLGTIPVAILSTADFDAPAMIDVKSLTFGQTGDDTSLAFCNNEDVNEDGLTDLVCHFYTQSTGFQNGDTEGFLKGQTMDGVPIEGSDNVNVLK